MKKLKDMRSIARGTTIKGLAAITLAAGLICGFGSAAHGQSARGATYTNLTVDTKDIGGRTVATLALSVAGDSDGIPTGTVTLMDGNKSVAGAVLNSNGTVTVTLDGLKAGEHSLKAVYSGDAGHEASTSDSQGFHAEASAAPDFLLAISSTSLTVAAPGDAISLTATVTPENGFTGFLSLSCSGPSISSGAPGGSALPVGVTCTYVPANLEITAGTTANPTGTQSADLTVQTTAPGGQNTLNQQPKGIEYSRPPLVLAFLLPGIAGLGFLGRKRKRFFGTALLTLLGGITILGTSACNPRYRYLNHPPTYNPGTTAGVYAMTVTAQTSNGVTATEHSQSLTLTVK